MISNIIWIGILAATLMIFILVAAVLFVIISARKQRLVQELKEADYLSRLNTVTLTALRSQMNPHFIFNCLNSIKYFTEQNNSDAAVTYLNKFAKLIRKSLDNAGKDRIILSEEMATLSLYLELEAMRFKNKLSFEIIIDKNVDTEFVELPPMIIQPYAENAIWHGIMPREKGGRVMVHVSQDDDSAVSIRISDNGIGRVQAGINRKSSDPDHISAGTKITGERISLLNEKYPGSAEITVQDEYDEQQHAAGTTVTIKLPLV